MRSAKIALILFLLVDCGRVSSNSARVEGSLDSTSLAAAQGPLQVMVVGTALSTKTDAAGRFTLNNVPARAVPVRFAGSGVDATVTLIGLTAGQTLRITVHIIGNAVEVATLPPDPIRLTGSISAVGASSITVSGIEVDTDANTEFVQNEAAIHFADLKAGDIVRVEGTLQAGGKLLARSIHRFLPPDFDKVSLAGVVDTLAAPNLTISGLTISTDSNTRFGGNLTMFADLKAGDQVVVRGTLRPDGSVLATRVTRGDGEEDEAEDEVDGAIASIAPPDSFMVGNTKVVVNASTQIEGEATDGGQLSFADLKVGDHVQVEGATQSDGSFLAATIDVGGEGD